MRRLTPTSFLVLAFLTLRRWSAYELAEQVARGWADYWPRAVSGIYEEPKKLLAHGLATMAPEPTGARPRSVYEATAAGRRALQEWVSQPSEPPKLECEAVLRVAFADHADKDVLLAQLRGVAAFSRRQALKYAEQGAGYLENGGPFPKRLHLNLLIGRFLAEHLAALMRWSAWAQEEVAGWTGVKDASAAPAVESGLAKVVDMFNGIVDVADVDGRVRTGSGSG